MVFFAGLGEVLQVRLRLIDHYIVLTIWIGKRCSWLNGNHIEGAIQLVSCNLSYLQHSRQKNNKKNKEK